MTKKRGFRYKGSVVTLHVRTDLRDDFVLEVLTPAERWVAVALRLLIADCPYRPVLCIAPGYPMTDAEVARQMRVPITLWRKTKRKLLKAGHIEWDPKVGIRHNNWEDSNSQDKRQLRFKHKERSLLPLSEKELREDKEDRTTIMNLWNEITGSVFDPDLPLFVKSYRDRVAEGATLQQILVVVRRCGWATQYAHPKTQYYMRPDRIIGAASFWKWVNKQGAEEATGRIQSTREYMSSLSTPALKKKAWALVSEYDKVNKLEKRRNGWDSLAETDFRKMMTCKEYLLILMDKE